MKAKICPHCFRGQLKRRSKPMTYRFKGRSVVLKQPGEWCNYCDEGILNGADLQATESTLKDFRQSVRQEIAKSYRSIRQKLGLTQKQAGEIFGGGINAFSRYERGITEAPLATEKLLRLLDKHPELLKEVKA